MSDSATNVKRLRVAYSFPFKLGSPGIGAAALSQIGALVDQGCIVDVYCWAGPSQIPGVHRIFKTRNLLPVPQRLVGRERACRFHDFVAAKLLSFRGEGYDVVHTWPLGAELTLKAARALNALAVREAPNTHTAHAFDVVAQEHGSLGVPMPKGNPHRANPKVLEREAREYEAADLILAPSEVAIDTFVQRGVPLNKLALKAYGFDASFYTHERRAPGHVLTFAFVARCEPRKGLHVALTAWRRSGLAKRSKFLVVGRFIPGYRERLAELLQHENVLEQGFVNDLRGIYRRTDVLVLPSIEEGSALVTYEAQASGCALLVSDASGARLQNGVEGFVHRAGDVDSLVGHMQRLADDPNLLRRMQDAAAKNAQHYTWQEATAALIEAYGAALSARAG